MRIKSPKYVQTTSVFVFLLSILFFVFFDKTKHIPALAQVNPFAVDPYDAVGSFGIQIALSVALLSVIRGFRPYGTRENFAIQTPLIVRGEIVVFLSVVVTLAGDIISMLRYLSMWASFPSGRILAAMVAAMLAVTVMTGLLIFRNANIHWSPASSKPAAILCCLAALILVIYPSAWDQGLLGGISTAVLGMLLFFTLIWALLKGFTLEISPQHEDFINDLAAIYHWIEDYAGFAKGLFRWVDNLTDKLWVRPIFEWLNPRNHAWNFVGLIAVTAGITLALVEAIGEGMSPDVRKAAIVMSVFIGIEGLGILSGYGLLARFLGIYRTTKSV